MPDVIPAELWQEASGRWRARAGTKPPRSASGATREACLDGLRAAVEGLPGPLVVEERPRLVGVAEAAAILGWDKRRVITYVDRGRFPEPLARLAGGRVWRREDVEAWAGAWRARQGPRE